MVNTNFKTALAKIEALEMAKIEALPKAEFIHSSEYLNKIEQIFEFSEKKAKKISVNRLIAIIAAAIVIIALSLTACTFREAIFDFFEEMSGNRMNLTANGAKLIEREMSVGYVPGVFTQTEEIRDSLSVIITYQHKETKEKMTYEQYPSASSLIWLNLKNAEYEKINDEKTVYYKHEKGGLKTLIWRDSEYSYVITCYADISWDEMFKSAKSITLN